MIVIKNVSLFLQYYDIHIWARFLINDEDKKNKKKKNCWNRLESNEIKKNDSVFFVCAEEDMRK